VDAVVPRIGDVDRAIGRHRHVPGLVEALWYYPLPLERRLASPGGDELALGGPFLDAMIARIRNVDETIGTHLYAVGALELSGL
jgi:hypothetical protein